jgi:hypothetical protein
VDGVQLDASGSVHVVSVRNDVERSTETRYYASDARGRWMTRQLGAGTELSLPPVLLSYDVRRDRLVLVAGDASERQIRVWSKRPVARNFGTKRSWGLGKRSPLGATGVAAYDGWVTVVGAGSGGRPALLVGRTTASSGRTVRIRGGLAIDRDPVVAAVSAGRVHLAWTRSVRRLDEELQGVWTAVLHRNSSGRWVTTAPTRRTRSGFDHLEGLAADRAGRVTLLVRRGVDSPFESGDPYG